MSGHLWPFAEEVKNFRVLQEVLGERRRQHERFGEQNLPDGTGTVYDLEFVRHARRVADAAMAAGDLSWSHVLTEEYAEAVVEVEVAALRRELIQVAAVAVQWVEAIDRRGS